MPRVQAALKALRQTKKRTSQNQRVKSQLTALIRKVRKSIVAKDQALAQKWLKETIKGLDKAAQKRVIKKNTAARKKSRLARQVNALITVNQEIGKSSDQFLANQLLITSKSNKTSESI